MRTNKLKWLLSGNPENEMVREIHGLFGTVGELVFVSMEAEVEKELLRRALEAPNIEPPMSAALKRSMRVFAEVQMNDLIVLGHQLANLTLRTMMLTDSHVSSDQPTNRRRDTPEPGSHEFKAWVSLNDECVGKLLVVAKRTQIPELSELATSLCGLTGPNRPWQELYKLRNEQYHRWRGESPGVTGVNFELRPMSSETVPLWPVQNYSEGEQIVENVSKTSRKALDSVAPFMSQYLDDWNTAFSVLLTASSVSPESQ